MLSDVHCYKPLIHQFFLMTLGQGQWPGVMSNVYIASGNNLKKIPSNVFVRVLCKLLPEALYMLDPGSLTLTQGHQEDWWTILLEKSVYSIELSIQFGCQLDQYKWPCVCIVSVDYSLITRSSLWKNVMTISFWSPGGSDLFENTVNRFIYSGHLVWGVTSYIYDKYFPRSGVSTTRGPIGPRFCHGWIPLILTFTMMGHSIG